MNNPNALLSASTTVTAIMWLALVLCIVLSGLFSAMETAYSTASKVRLTTMSDEGDKKAGKVLKLLNNYEKVLFTVLVGNNIVNIIATTLATLLFIAMMGDIGATVSTIVITVVVLLFGEISPKMLAKQHPEGFAKNVYGFLRVCMFILTPITFILDGWKWLLSKIFRFPQTASFSEEELITIVETAENEGQLEKHESELIRSAIEFEDLDVRDIMVPRVNVEAVPEDATMEEIYKVFVESGYSRLPVYRDDIDTIVGILHEKDFSVLLHDGGTDIKPLIKKCIYLTQSIKISTALGMLQKEKIHMAIVVDEFGGTDGIVTLEDILEELVGEIYDEHDSEEEQIKKIDDHTYIIKGDENFEEMLEELDVKSPDEETEATTVGGFVSEQLDRMPAPGDKLTVDGMEMEVIKATDKKVDEIKVTVLPTQDEDDD
ncbi:MAG: HlyC/CorC family transporter [Firmicutes bacterium]|nr:HlyC/CorC family transporter [Bacillota bacterium]